MPGLRLFPRRWIYSALAGVALALLPMPLVPAFAQELGGQSTVMTGISVIVGIIMTAIEVLLWVLYIFIDLLLDPTFIFNANGPGGGILPILHEIWQFSRDIVNVIFAFLLIGGAVYTVVTGDSEKVNGMRIKFVLTVILVNFSWFIPRVVYDVSQITAYTVFQIPSMLNRTACVVPDETGALQECVAVQNVVFFQETQRIPNPSPRGWTCFRPLFCYQSVPLSQAPNLPMRTKIINGLIVNHARLKSLNTIPDVGAIIDPGGGLLQLGTALLQLIRMLIVLVIHVAIFFPLLAMVVVFFARIPIIWLTMAFMPFVALTYIVPESFFPSEFKLKEKIMNAFLNAAFLPTYVAVPLAVGYVLLNAGMQMAPNLTGLLGVPIPLLAGVSNIWQLMWLLMALVVLWVGVFGALKSQKITEGTVNTIQQMGTSVAKLPMAAPIIPIPKGDGTHGQASIGGLLGRIDPRNILADMRRREGQQQGGANLPPPQRRVDEARQVIQNQNLRVQIENNNVRPGNIQAGDVEAQDIARALQQLQQNDEVRRGAFRTDELLHAILDLYNIRDEDHRRRFLERGGAPVAPGARATPR